MSRTRVAVLFAVGVTLAAALGSGLTIAGLGGAERAVRPSGSDLLRSPDAPGLGSELAEDAAAAHPSSLPSGPPTWSNVTSVVGSPAPGPRQESMLTWDAADGYLLMYGGYAPGDFSPVDTWTYSNGSWTNLTSAVTGHPPPVVEAGFAYDPSTRSVILFGGRDPAGVWTNYTWSYHDRVWTNLTPTLARSPPVMENPSLSTDTAGNGTLLVGNPGFGPWQTWSFHAGHWSNVAPPLTLGVSSFPPRLGDLPSAGGVLLLTVASNTTAVPWHPVTWEFVGGNWTNLTSTNWNGPRPFTPDLPAMGYLPASSSLILSTDVWLTPAGGVELYPATWEFTGGLWANVTASTGGTAPGVTWPAQAAIPTDSSYLSFGGFNVDSDIYPNATWALSAAPTVSGALSASAVDVGTPVRFTGSSSGGLDPVSARLDWGDGTVTGADSGTHTFAARGLFAVTLTATDLLDRSGSVAFPLVVNPSPSLNLTVLPAAPTTGGAVLFAADVSGGTGPFNFSWSFGDGGTSGGSSSSPTFSASHTYSSARTFLVSLAVTDSDGVVAHANATVVVGPTPPGSVDLTSGTGLALLLVILVLGVALALLAVLLARRSRPGPPPRPPPVPAEVSPPPPPPPPPDR